MIRIVEAEIRHVGIIARASSAGHLWCAEFGKDPRRVIRSFFRQSAYRRTALYDERPIAIWGLTGSFVDSTGILWLHLTQEARQNVRRLITECRRELARMMELRQEIVCYFYADDMTAIRFARFFGFEVGDPAPIEGLGIVGRRGILRRSEGHEWHS